MARNYLSILILTLSAIFPTSIIHRSYAQTNNIIYHSSFYKIQKVRMNCFIADDSTEVKLQYHIQNTSKGALDLKLKILQPFAVFYDTTKTYSFRLKKFEKNIHFEYGDKVTTDFIYKIPNLGNGFKLIQVDPSILLDDNLYADKVDEYQIHVSFPRSAKKLIQSSHPLIPKNLMRIGRKGMWSGQNVRLYPFWVKWTEINIDVDITKSISITNNVATLTVTVENKKSEVVENLKLRDSFSPGNIEPISPKDEFIALYPKNSDMHYYWQKNIDKLYPNRPMTYQYQIKFEYAGTNLSETVAILDSVIVAMSNDVSFELLAPTPLFPTINGFVSPAGFHMNYKGRNTDHHINECSYRIDSQSYNNSNSTLSWETKISYCDKNKDDDYKWDIYHTILRLQDAFTHQGSTDWINDNGGKSSHSGSFNSNNLKGYEHAVVFIGGCYFDYKSKDHHIKSAGLTIRNIQYDSSSGSITWDTEAIYRDKNGDDDYRWKYWYQVIAFNSGYLGYEYDIEITDNNGGSFVDSHTHQNEVLQGEAMPFGGFKALYKQYQSTIVPLGWQFTFSKKDHHIKQIGLNFQNITYVPNGWIKWDAHLNYADKNSDDAYKGKYSVAVLAFKHGEVRYLKELSPEGPFSDNGGTASKNYQHNLNDLFIPITWYNNTMDGNEEGIDCGGDSPIECMECLTYDWSSLTPYIDHPWFFMRYNILPTANEALLRYADFKGVDPDTFYTGYRHANRYVEAVAWFVEENMEWMSDGTIPDVQTAGRTIHSSGERECGKRFCGDCEDFSILRGVLLRCLGFDWKCIFSADHHESENQGQVAECGSDEKKDHTFNLVYYKGRYRILDYGEMSIRRHADCNAHHAVDNIWNDNYGELWFARKLKPFGGKLLMNYPGCPTCPSTSWNWRTYYWDICK